MRNLWTVLLSVLLLPVLALRAGAAGCDGTIRVTLEEPDAGAAITLYRVGEPVEGGYRMAAIYGGGLVRQEDKLSPHLAMWLAQTPWDAGVSQGLDHTGTAEFTGLCHGLYLLVQTETGTGSAFRPFLVCLPYEGRWQVNAYPGDLLTLSTSPRTGQSPVPFLGAAGMVLSAAALAACVRKLRQH